MGCMAALHAASLTFNLGRVIYARRGNPASSLATARRRNRRLIAGHSVPRPFLQHRPAQRACRVTNPGPSQEAPIASRVRAWLDADAAGAATHTLKDQNKHMTTFSD